MPRFTDSLVGENVEVATEYFKALVAESNKTSNSGGTIGFIPFNISFTMDGLSGIKIYDEMSMDVSFLPPGYSKTLDFIVTGVDHKLKNGDWETDIKATVIPKTSIIDRNQIIKGSAPIVKQQENTKPPPSPVLSAAGGSTLSAATVSGTAITGGDADFWTLLAICTLEDLDPQGRADVAQSIYNRVGAGPTGGYGKLATSIAGVIKSKSQYEPAFSRSNKGGSNTMNVHPIWNAISSKQTAINALLANITADYIASAKAAKKTPEEFALLKLKETYNALSDPTLQQNSKSFIQGRTDFLSITQGTVAQRNTATNSGTATRATFVMRNTGTPNNVYGFAGSYTKNVVFSPPPASFWDKYRNQF